ncbi:hypothetical protein AQUCO_04000023v1 [Aquilegia coerulea]|uniref:AMP-dependent synthetase/ligase domain-containing protein n=1 Tax=Aquilegia coerulea TaxID=218851 RepID=A0A2G5CQT2_AQUCA|nr:hypothetical protein AQUCO_04000023v1 [Aquilegia coerulea]
MNSTEYSITHTESDYFLMENSSNTCLINPTNGYCSQTKTFNSLRPLVSLPPPNSPISASQYAFFLFHQNSSSSSSSKTTALIDSNTGYCLSYSQFIHQTQNLASSLQNKIGLSKGDIAFVLSSNCLQIPILFCSLLSLGVVISPANPISTKSEISRQIGLCKATIAFATSSTAYKLPSLHHKTILLDSSEFHSLTTSLISRSELKTREEVIQSDLAAILYSSGTTGKVKGVMLTHWNLTAIVAAIHAVQQKRETPAVVLYTMPYFHVYGFFYSLKSIAMGESVVLMDKFDLRRMLKVVEQFKVTFVAVAPPVIVGMVKNDDLIKSYDLSSLEGVGCGGAPLGKEVIEKFKERFPNVSLGQGYGLTESTGGLFRSLGPEEGCRYGSAGRILSNCQAKIIDPDTGIALPPCKLGELWIRGPLIMKGYVGDDEATSAMLDSEGWLKTGDLCYIDSDGYLFVVDRLKELIKYKGYQVSPAELEQLLQSHPAISDAAVVPYPDEEAGEIPMGFVVRQQDNNINETQIIDFIAKQVTSIVFETLSLVSCVNH